LNKPSIILIIACSLDGRIALPIGGKTHLGTSEDKKILNKALLDVDATLFGSGTLVAHQCTYLVKENLFSNNSTISDFQPISIVAGDHRKFSNEWKYFRQPISRWLINCNQTTYEKINGFDKQFLFRNSWKETFNFLYNEGINKIGLLGGSKLITSIAYENLIDEIKITIVPKLVGGKYLWIKDIFKSDELNLQESWEVNSIKNLETNEIFIHYTKKIQNF